jgi:hypothetical protein
VAEGISSLNLYEKWTILNRISTPCKANLTHTLGTSTDSSKVTVYLSFRLMEQGHHKRLKDRTHTNCAGHTSVAWLHDHTPVCCAERSPTGRCVRKTKLQVVRGMSTPRADWLLGLPLYHISRPVASTFKRLATTITHCDLINFYQHRQGNLSSYDTVHDPVHDTYSDCRIVNIQLLYHASDRKSPDFYRSY